MKGQVRWEKRGGKTTFRYFWKSAENIGTLERLINTQIPEKINGCCLQKKKKMNGYCDNAK